MVEVMRSSSFGQDLSPSDSVEVMGMSDRFKNMNVNLDSIREESQPANEQPAAARDFKGAAVHNPRRAYSSTDQAATTPTSLALRTQHRLISPAQTPRERGDVVDSYFQLRRTLVSSVPASPRAPHPSSSIQQSLSSSSSSSSSGISTPQRSYSVMDVEPVPFTHQPGVNLTLADLPAELHYTLFEFLDPIDSTCLALTSKHFYAVHRQMHGRVPLSARREGPNDMEWVWRHSGPFVSFGTAGGRQNALAMLSPRGQVYCRKCRTSRCELRNHIREWMGPGREYCEVRQKFGAPAPEGARAVCFKSSPRHPGRCGRHTGNRVVRLT